MSRVFRRILRVFAAASLLVVVAAATLPWWLPALAVKLAPRFGAAVGGWESRGWRGFILHEVVWTGPGLRVTAAEASLPVLGMHPLGWRPREGASVDEPPIVARGVVVTPLAGAPADEAGPASVHEILRGVLDARAELRRWLPPARIDGLEIEAGAETIRIDRLSWDGAALAFRGRAPRLDASVEGSVRFPTDDSLVLRARMPEPETGLEITATVDPAEARLEARLTGGPGAASARATFGPSGSLPLTAVLEAPAVELDGAWLGLPDYGAVRGRIAASWDGAAFALQASARAEPRAEAEARPPLELELDAAGDAGEVRVEALRVRAPGLEADLSRPLRVALPGLRPDGPATLRIAAELERLPFPDTRGRLEGEARVEVDETAGARATFALRGRHLAWRTHALEGLALEGAFNGRELALTALEAQAGDGATATGSARLDLAGRTVLEATLRGVASAARVRAFAPEFPSFGSATFEVAAEGPFDGLRHRGGLEWTALEVLPDDPLEGRLSWSGVGARRAELEAEVRSASGVTLPLVAGIERGASGAIDTVVRSLAWNDAAGTWWELLAPARLRFEPGAGPRLALEEARLGGGTAVARLAGALRGAAAGSLELELEGFEAARLGERLPERLAGVAIAHARLEARWDHGPVEAEGSARITHAVASEFGYEADLAFRTAGETLELPTLRVVDASGVVLEGAGRLPLALVAGAEGWTFGLPEDGPLEFAFTSAPNSAFWKSVESATGWAIVEPRVSIDLAGTLRAPEGRIAASVAALDPPAGGAEGGAPLPALKELRLAADATPAGLVVREAHAVVDGNPVAATASIPWELWNEWRDVASFPWRKAALSVTARALPVEQLARYFPMALGGEGTVDLELAHRPGAGYAGRLRLEGAALRPLPPVGAIRDIGATVRLEGYALELVDATCTLGGRPVSFEGRVDLAAPERPVFDLRVRGERTPIVRQPGLVLRTSLDLRLAGDGRRPARITGEAELAPSVLVSDLRALLPTGGVSVPERRPPYFSVTAEPFADWVLDVAVRGERFLRVENPLFDGTVSADFKLEGTLREPRLVGRASARDGSVRFPFATLGLEQMDVVLAPENPHRPTLAALGRTRLFGYDVRMEATGPADEPQLLFSSDPPLSSQDVFLMVTTGALPAAGNTISADARARRLALYLGRSVAEGLGLGAEGGDRLTVRTGENFSAQGRETVHIQYDLDGRWSLVGEYDRFDAYNGGLKFRLIDR